MAYSKAKGENIKKKKILFIHTHLVSWTKRFIDEINPENTEIIHIIRHPLASLNSPIKNWLNYDNGKHFYRLESPINAYGVWSVAIDPVEPNIAIFFFIRLKN